jgi:lysophospholipase L1-like esterase
VYGVSVVLAHVEHQREVSQDLTRGIGMLLGAAGGVVLCLFGFVVVSWHERYDKPLDVNTAVPPVHGRFSDYVALGDSYSAGEGLSPYLAGAGDPPRGDNCHRSPQAYSQQLTFEPPLTAPIVFRACSGAVANDVFAFAQYPKLGPQIKPGMLGPKTDLITLTMGGNDVHFSDVLQFCARTLDCLDQRFTPSAIHPDQQGILPPATLQTWATGMYDVLHRRLVTLLQQLHTDAPNARIVVIGYPKLLPTGDVPRQFDSCDVLLRAIDGKEREGISKLEVSLNDMIYGVTRDNGAEFIDPTDSFASHEACGVKGELLNNVKFANDLVIVDRGSFHPRAQGQRVLARELACYLDEYPTRPTFAASTPAPGSNDNPIKCP